MAHLIGPGRSQGGMHASVGIAIALSLLVATTVEGTHTHAEADMSAMCSVCEIGHQGVPTSAGGPPVIGGAGVLQAPTLPGHQLFAGIVHLSAHRSRAPPLPVSL